MPLLPPNLTVIHQLSTAATARRRAAVVSMTVEAAGTVAGDPAAGTAATPIDVITKRNRRTSALIARSTAPGSVARTTPTVFLQQDLQRIQALAGVWRDSNCIQHEKFPKELGSYSGSKGESDSSA
jgi:hypothetical protein